MAPVRTRVNSGPSLTLWPVNRLCETTARRQPCPALHWYPVCPCVPWAHSASPFRTLMKVFVLSATPPLAEPDLGSSITTATHPPPPNADIGTSTYTCTPRCHLISSAPELCSLHLPSLNARLVLPCDVTTTPRPGTAATANISSEH